MRVLPNLFFGDETLLLQEKGWKISFTSTINN